MVKFRASDGQPRTNAEWARPEAKHQGHRDSTEQDNARLCA